MRSFRVLPVLLTTSLLALLACGGSGTADGSATGEIVVGNQAGVQFLYVSIGYPGIPSTGGGQATPYRGKPVTVGACTYFPPPSPVATATLGGAGTPNTAADAGTISIVDTTSHATLGTYSYSSDADYTPLSGASPSNPWHSGDTLTATATGGPVGAFVASVPTLATPAVAFPSTFSRDEDLTLTWTPDPNAQSMTVGIADGTYGQSISCEVADSLGTVTIDSSLFASFESRQFATSDGFTLSAWRETDETIHDGDNSLQMRSVATSSATIQATKSAGVCPSTAPSIEEGCLCPSGTVCVTKPQSGGQAFMGCVDIPSSCDGKATCACMGCLCGGLGLSCDSVEFDASAGSGTDLHCK